MNSNRTSFDDRVKPKNVLALNEKVAAIRRYEADPVYKSVGRYFNCSPDQIKRIIKQKNEILAEWNNRTRKSIVPSSHELKSVKMSFLGKAVHEWIRRMMYYTDFNLTDALIQTMAIEFKKVLGLQNFFPDKIWIGNFRSTYGLREVNTKTLDIGYQESFSVQIRDILRHLNVVCGTNATPEAKDKCEVIIASHNAGSISLQEGNCKLKEEPSEDGYSSNAEMSDKYEACQPSCSSTAVSRVSGEIPITIVKTESMKDVISTHEEAINCVKLLEEFALLKENFRLIGLIERLEEALKEKQ